MIEAILPWIGMAIFVAVGVGFAHFYGYGTYEEGPPIKSALQQALQDRAK